MEECNKFAAQFNSMFNHRIRLWNIGFMSELDHLPGLVTTEYKSLSAILLSNFMMYFNPKRD